MQLNIDKIVSDKLLQMEQDKVIESKIEETLQKTIVSAVTDALTDYKFKRDIMDQISESVHEIASSCGIKAYNGFIAEKAADIVRECYSVEFGDRVRSALDNLMVQRYDNIKLSQVFAKYREWVCLVTDEHDKYEREHFTGELDVQTSSISGNKVITCKFADHPLEGTYLHKEEPDITLKFFLFGKANSRAIDVLYFDGRDMKNSIKIGFLTDFEQFVLNLYYNKTPIELDLDDISDDDSFDIDI